jgi:hypothetical protein
VKRFIFKVDCNADEQVIGGGGLINGEGLAGDAYMEGSYPTADGKGWEVKAAKIATPAGDWSITTWAYCIPEASP